MCCPPFLSLLVLFTALTAVATASGFLDTNPSPKFARRQTVADFRDLPVTFAQPIQKYLSLSWPSFVVTNTSTLASSLAPSDPSSPNRIAHNGLLAARQLKPYEHPSNPVRLVTSDFTGSTASSFDLLELCFACADTGGATGSWAGKTSEGWEHASTITCRIQVTGYGIDGGLRASVPLSYDTVGQWACQKISGFSEMATVTVQQPDENVSMLFERVGLEIR